jgi:uncharacterized glyoxalase superfamily protein PhnB
MTDPFEQLRSPIQARTPPAGFVRDLRRRLLDALELTPPDPNRPGRNPMTTTDTTGTVTGLQAYLAVSDAAAAIDFYTDAFAATEVFRVVGDDRRIGHAELRLGAVTLMLADEYPEVGAVAPTSLGGSPVLLYLQVDDCDAAHDRALAAGATSERAPADQTHGNRVATLRDPFGHRWMLAQPIAPLDLEDYAARETGSWQVEAAPAAARTEGTVEESVWSCLNSGDAPSLIRLLVEVFDFDERLVVADETNPSVIHHSELRWPGGGGVMIGSSGRPDDEYAQMPIGTASVYLVTDRVDELWDRAVGAGLTVVRELRDEDYGSRGFSVRDPEGNIWSFGTYPPS